MPADDTMWQFNGKNDREMSMDISMDIHIHGNPDFTAMSEWMNGVPYRESVVDWSQRQPAASRRVRHSCPVPGRRTTPARARWRPVLRRRRRSYCRRVQWCEGKSVAGSPRRRWWSREPQGTRSWREHPSPQRVSSRTCSFPTSSSTSVEQTITC